MKTFTSKPVTNCTSISQSAPDTNGYDNELSFHHERTYSDANKTFIRHVLVLGYWDGYANGDAFLGDPSHNPSDSHPYAGKSDAGRTWTEDWVAYSDCYDFIRDAWDIGPTNAGAWLCFYVYVPAATKVKLKVAVDDCFMIFHTSDVDEGGEHWYSVTGDHAFAWNPADPNYYPYISPERTFSSGWNKILVKAGQSGGDWKIRLKLVKSGTNDFPSGACVTTSPSLPYEYTWSNKNTGSFLVSIPSNLKTTINIENKAIASAYLYLQEYTTGSVEDHGTLTLYPYRCTYTASTITYNTWMDNKESKKINYPVNWEYVGETGPGLKTWRFNIKEIIKAHLLDNSIQSMRVVISQVDSDWSLDWHGDFRNYSYYGELSPVYMQVRYYDAGSISNYTVDGGTTGDPYYYTDDNTPTVSWKFNHPEGVNAAAEAWAYSVRRKKSDGSLVYLHIAAHDPGGLLADVQTHTITDVLTWVNPNIAAPATPHYWSSILVRDGYDNYYCNAFTLPRRQHYLWDAAFGTTYHVDTCWDKQNNNKIVYNHIPDAPTSSLMIPGNNAELNTGSIRFAWNFADDDPSDTQKAAQVMIKNETLDKDPVLITVGSVQETYVTLLDGGEYYWKVRVMDLWNQYSDWTQHDMILFVPGDSPTLLEPANNANVPLGQKFRWVHEGSTRQVGFEIQVFSEDDLGEPIYTYNTVRSNLQECYLPPDILEKGEAYRWRVRTALPPDSAPQWSGYSELRRFTVTNDTTYLLEASRFTYISQASDVNFNSSSVDYADFGSSGGQRRLLMLFPIPPELAAEAPVRLTDDPSYTKLVLFAAYTKRLLTTNPYLLYKITSDWNVDTVKWSTAPTVASLGLDWELQDINIENEVATEFDLDHYIALPCEEGDSADQLTELIGDWINGSTSNYGLMLRVNHTLIAGEELRFEKDEPNHPHYLVAHINNLPVPTNLDPGELEPSSEEIPSLYDIDFSWDIIDDPGDTQTGFDFWIQRDIGGVWTDDPDVTRGGPGSDGIFSRSIATQGVNSNFFTVDGDFYFRGSTNYRWKVRTEDNHGEQGLWDSCDWAYFHTQEQVAPNVPTLVWPQNGDSASTTTPMVSWEFSDPNPDSIQGAFYVHIYDDDRSLIYDSGKVASASQSWAIPTGVLSWDQDYFIRLALEDQYGFRSAYCDSVSFHVRRYWWVQCDWMDGEGQTSWDEFDRFYECSDNLEYTGDSRGRVELTTPDGEIEGDDFEDEIIGDDWETFGEISESDGKLVFGEAGLVIYDVSATEEMFALKYKAPTYVSAPEGLDTKNYIGLVTGPLPTEEYGGRKAIWIRLSPSGTVFTNWEIVRWTNWVVGESPTEVVLESGTLDFSSTERTVCFSWYSDSIKVIINNELAAETTNFLEDDARLWVDTSDVLLRDFGGGGGPP